MKQIHVFDFLEEFSAELKKQLELDETKWGDTWLKRTREGQEDRIFNTLIIYYKDYQKDGAPIPWLKVAGNALIAWIREKHPELFPK